MAKIFIGKILCRLFYTALLLLVASTAHAAIVVSLDRHQITIDDTFTMTIRVTAGEDLDNIDLAPLDSNFDILGRSQNSRHIFGSGGNDSWSELALTLAPKHTGTLYIPPLALDKLKTAPTQIIVRESSPLPAGSLEPVFLEIETDKDSVLVQEQLILTIRIFQSINLDNPSISELKLDGSFVEQISQSSGQRRLNNTPYLVHEIKYAIFPQRSGELTIPSLTFSGTQLSRRRSLFDMGGQGKVFRRQSKEKTIKVSPIPANINSKNWLPAEQLTIEESWSTPPEELVIGESATRTLTVKAKGLLSEQLPPLLPPVIDGLKFYPDQPKLENQQNELGTSSLRIDSSAMVITKEGDITIPGIKLSWWDTSQHKLRWASIPPRSFQIQANANTEILNNTPLSIASSELNSSNKEVDVTQSPTLVTEDLEQLRLWQLLTVFATLAWLLTSFLLIKTRKQSQIINTEAANTQNLAEKKLYKKLIDTCRGDTPRMQRAAVIQWAQSYWQNPGITTLAQVAENTNDGNIQTLLSELDLSLYSPSENSWNSASLAASLDHYRKSAKANDKSKSSKLQKLYKTSS